MDYSSISNEELERLVNNKDGDAICELGERCLYGKNGHKVNLTRAYQLFHKGEKMGLSRAYIGLGEMYRNGWYMAQNEQLARDYYSKAGTPYPEMGNINSVNQNFSKEVKKDINKQEQFGVINSSSVTKSQMGSQVFAQTNRQAGVQKANVNGKGNSGNKLQYQDIKSKLDSAEKARKKDEYDITKRFCNEVIRDVHNIESGMVDYIGNEDIEDFLIDAYWILAFTAFNEKKYSDMENYLSMDNVQAVHPWGIYLIAVSHQMIPSSSILLEQDLQMLLTVSRSINLSPTERGDVCAMIGDLIREGYGEKSGISPDMAKSYYEDAVQLGNEYAKDCLYEMN